MEKTADKVGVFSHRLSSSYLESVLGPRSIKEEDEQATESVVGNDGLRCLCLRFSECVWAGPVYADCVSIIIVY